MGYIYAVLNQCCVSTGKLYNQLVKKEAYYYTLLQKKDKFLGHSVSSGLVAVRALSLIWVILLYLTYFHN